MKRLTILFVALIGTFGITASAQSLTLPIQLHVEGLQPGTRITFDLTCRLEARDYLAAALSGSVKAAPIMGTDGPWKDELRVQSGLDAKQGRAPFVFHLGTGPKQKPQGTLLTAVFDLAYEYQQPGKTAYKQRIRLTRIDPERPIPLGLHFVAHGTLPDGSPNLTAGVYPLGKRLE